MTGIDFVDTIVVRRSVEKGTKIISEPAKKLSWAGEEFRKYSKTRQKLAGDVGLASSKGTSKIYLSKMSETKIPSLKGHYLSTGRGTAIRMA